MLPSDPTASNSVTTFARPSSVEVLFLHDTATEIFAVCYLSFYP